VYDIEFKTNDGINASKLFFLSWLPESAKIKIKMLYASGKESLKNYLDLNGKEISVSTVD
jgi:cofilin